MTLNEHRHTPISRRRRHLIKSPDSRVNPEPLEITNGNIRLIGSTCSIIGEDTDQNACLILVMSTRSGRARATIESAYRAAATVDLCTQFIDKNAPHPSRSLTLFVALSEADAAALTKAAAKIDLTVTFLPHGVLPPPLHSLERLIALSFLGEYFPEMEQDGDLGDLNQCLTHWCDAYNTLIQDPENPPTPAEIDAYLFPHLGMDT